MTPGAPFAPVDRPTPRGASRADGVCFVRDEIRLADGRSVGEAIEADRWIEDEILRPVFERDERGLPAKRLLYFELARGHAKSLYGAAIATAEAALHDSTDVIVAAGDKDQASIVLDHLRGFIARNAALAAVFSIGRDELRVRDSRIRVIPSDAATAWGHGGVKRRFRVIVDELTSWPDRGEAFWVALASATGKVKDSQTIVFSNAGYGAGTSWQWRVRETAERKDWALLLTGDGVLASWIDEQWLEQQRELLPASAYERVILNRWVAETGDFVTREQWRRCVDPGLRAQVQGVREVGYYGGLDLGLTKDRTAFAVVHVDPADGQTVYLDELQVWAGTRKQPFQIETVERALVDAKRRYPRLRVWADPWQLKGSIQRLSSGSVQINEFTFSQGSVARLSALLYEVISDASLHVFDDSELEAEVLGLQVVQTASGWRIDHRAGGFSDRVMALGMALQEAVRHRRVRTGPREESALDPGALSRGVIAKVF